MENERLFPTDDGEVLDDAELRRIIAAILETDPPPELDPEPDAAPFAGVI